MKAAVCSEKPTIHAVIVDFFKASKVIRNLKTLADQYPLDKLSVSVIDNSTSHKNANLLKAVCEQENIHLTVNKINRGYTAACNQGAQCINADYILLLNPDIYWPQRQSLQILVDAMESSPKTIICGPRQINPEGDTAGTIRFQPSFLELIRRRISWLDSLFCLVSGRSSGFFAPDYNKDQTVGWLQSSCLLVRNSFWKEVGGFDESYFLFMADLDLCRKAWKLGYEVRYVTSSMVYADGIRASAGGLAAIFTKPALRTHICDAIKYFATYHGQPWP